jgi:hypothetical protein
MKRLTTTIEAYGGENLIGKRVLIGSTDRSRSLPFLRVVKRVEELSHDTKGHRPAVWWLFFVPDPSDEQMYLSIEADVPIMVIERKSRKKYRALKEHIDSLECRLVSLESAWDRERKFQAAKFLSRGL